MTHDDIIEIISALTGSALTIIGAIAAVKYGASKLKKPSARLDISNVNGAGRGHKK